MDEPQYPTFYDEILAHVPKDRWIKFRELRPILWKRSKIPVGTLSWSLTDGVNKGYLLKRDTGLRAKRTYKDKPPAKIFEYIRIVDGRPINQERRSYNSRVHRPYKKQKRGVAPVKKKVRGANAKLTDDQVRELRMLFRSGTMSISALAQFYKLAYQTVSRIVQGKFYKDVD